jgi:hypothetical protein
MRFALSRHFFEFFGPRGCVLSGQLEVMMSILDFIGDVLWVLDFMDFDQLPLNDDVVSFEFASRRESRGLETSQEDAENRHTQLSPSFSRNWYIGCINAVDKAN